MKIIQTFFGILLISLIVTEQEKIDQKEKSLRRWKKIEEQAILWERRIYEKNIELFRFLNNYEYSKMRLHDEVDLIDKDLFQIILQSLEEQIEILRERDRIYEDIM